MRQALDDTAQDLVEYALLMAMLSLILLGILPRLTHSVNDRYHRAGATMRSVTYECDPANASGPPRSQCPD